ncbi:MAG: OprD family porin [Deltaproteobacteria bacterium]|nr:OprD family porin [Deltaproteobacteria bacterium]
MKTIVKGGILACALLLLQGMIVSGFAADNVKRTIKGNMTETYKILPESADNVSDMFSKGIFYGRLRTNFFRWNWGNTISGKTQDNYAIGIGGSMIYKSAYLHGLGMTAGLYTSQNPWHMDGDDYKFAKSGKDTFSRHKVASESSYGMTVLAQSFLEYKAMNSSLRAGRQIFESLLTKSNDTKMIPNTFEGVSLHSKYIPGTKVAAAFFTRQKLRDHTSFHHVLAFGDDPADPVGKWNENDDSAMHKGLTLSKLKAAGINDRLMIVQVTNKSIPGLSLMANYTAVPELIMTAAGEINYTVKFDNGLKIVPGFRYLQQFDRGAGAIGGASLKAKITTTDARGYSNPFNMDGKLYAARLDFKKGPASLRLGYSKIADKADILAPWRGFPTGGYTRAMAQYNWYADTETLMAQVKYNLGKAGMVPGLTAMVRYAIQNFDDKKPDVQADSKIFTLDLIEKIAAVPGLEVKGRMGIVSGDDNTVDMNGATKADPSYNEYRFEMNYLF